MLEPVFYGLLGGVGLGVFYFGGLWLSVRRLPCSRRPGRLLLASFAGRLLLVLAGLWLLLDRQPVMFFAALPAFFGVRLLMTGKLGSGGKLRLSQRAEPPAC